MGRLIIIYKMTTKGRYGLRAMVDLVLYEHEASTALSSISKRQGVSVNYLEQAFALLKKAQLVESIKGPKGGYKLTKPAEKTTVLEVLEVLEGPISIVEQGKESTFIAECVQELVWQTIDERLHDFLSQITLEELAVQTQQEEVCEPIMFYI